MCNSQHKSTAVPSGEGATGFKRDSEKAGWKDTSSYEAGRKFTSINQVVLGLIQKAHALPGRSTCTAVKTNSEAHAATSDLISLAHTPTASAERCSYHWCKGCSNCSDGPKGGVSTCWWIAADTFGHDIKVCVSHTMALPAGRLLWASPNQSGILSMSSLNKRWEIT